MFVLLDEKLTWTQETRAVLAVTIQNGRLLKESETLLNSSKNTGEGRRKDDLCKSVGISLLVCAGVALCTWGYKGVGLKWRSRRNVMK